jgi:TPR repeat protein
LAASAAAIAFSILSVENPLALFANAKASLIGISASPSNASQPASANQPVPSLQAAVDVRTLPATIREAPSRDEIVAAFKSAHQSQPEIRQPEIRQPAAATPPARRLSADELAALLKRARSLIAIGDFAPARLLLERAADAQEASAALLLAQTYDPAVLGTQDMRSITPDPAAARAWYEKAAQFGSPDAQQRLAQMQ